MEQNKCVLFQCVMNISGRQEIELANCKPCDDCKDILNLVDEIKDCKKCSSSKTVCEVHSEMIKNV